MYKVLEVPKNNDLSQFSRLLWQQKISHRIHHIDSCQVLTVADGEQVSTTGKLYREWVQGKIRPSERDSSSFVGYFSADDFARKLLRAFRRAPLSLLLILICIFLMFAAPLNSMNDTVRALLYPDFSFGTRMIILDRVLENFSFIQFLKMISPILLHGGLVHLTFNMLWLWEFGRRIEAVQASWSLLLLITVIALVSNSVQFLYAGTIYFGGMSGVVYGMFGYIWMWQLFDPAKGLGLPGALIFFLLLTLLVMTVINLDFIADEAHIGGILMGVIYGALTATISRIARARSYGQEGRSD